MVPAFSLLWTSHDQLNHHRVRYTKPSIACVAADAGLKIVASRYFFYWLFAAKLAARVKEGLFGATPAIPKVPPPQVNRFLRRVSRAEEKLLGKLPIPLGGSLLVLGRSADLPHSVNRKRPVPCHGPGRWNGRNKTVPHRPRVVGLRF